MFSIRRTHSSAAVFGFRRSAAQQAVPPGIGVQAGLRVSPLLSGWGGVCGTARALAEVLPAPEVGLCLLPLVPPGAWMTRPCLLKKDLGLAVEMGRDPGTWGVAGVGPGTAGTGLGGVFTFSQAELRLECD